MSKSLLLASFQMIHATPRLWIDESMFSSSASTSDFCREDGQTFETESGIAVSTLHLVTLCILCILLLQILFCDYYTTCWTLL